MRDREELRCHGNFVYGTVNFINGQYHHPHHYLKRNHTVHIETERFRG